VGSRLIAGQRELLTFAGHHFDVDKSISRHFAGLRNDFPLEFPCNIKDDSLRDANAPGATRTESDGLGNFKKPTHISINQDPGQVIQ
jgi:hypothetical protein